MATFLFPMCNVSTCRKKKKNAQKFKWINMARVLTVIFLPRLAHAVARQDWIAAPSFIRFKMLKQCNVVFFCVRVNLSTQKIGCFVMFTLLLCRCFSPFAAELMSRRPVENEVWTEEGDIYVLDNGRTARHFIDKKIQEFDSMVTKWQDLSLEFQRLVI